MKKLIINADDYGRCKGINYGIVETVENGILTSTTAMVNMPDFSHGRELSKKYPKLGVGIHFVLSTGKPLTNLKSLVNGEGNFALSIVKEKSDENKLDLEEIKIEFEAQLKKFVEVYGRKPTHIDSHHHVHLLPKIFEVAKEIAIKNNLPIRTLEKVSVVKCVDYFESSFYGKDATKENLIKILQKISTNKYEISEIMCHPGFLDKDVLKSGYNSPRLDEIEILNAEEVLAEIKKLGFQLVNYEEGFR